MTDQGNGTGQEPGTGTGGQGQEPASQQGQQGSGNQGTGQEPGNQGGGQGGSGQADISNMKPEELATYAAKLQKDAQEARQEAARYRTEHQAAQAKLTEAERAQMTEQQRIQTDLETTQQENQTLKAQVEDLTKGAAIREVLRLSGALNPGTAFKVGDWSGVKIGEDGTVDETSAKAALAKLKQSDPYLFGRTASADAGAGGGGAPEAGSSVNDFIRGGRGR